jgi:hypothetical protein
MILLPSRQVGGAVRRANRYDILEAVIIVLLILAAVTAGAQPTGDGVSLLRQVSEAARSAKGWRPEGHVRRIADHRIHARSAGDALPLRPEPRNFQSDRVRRLGDLEHVVQRIKRQRGSGGPRRRRSASLLLSNGTLCSIRFSPQSLPAKTVRSVVLSSGRNTRPRAGRAFPTFQRTG